MIFEKFRSTKCYRICGDIGIFALPVCLILKKWCKLVGGVAYGPALVALISLIPVSLLLIIAFISLSLGGFAESKIKSPKKEFKIKTNLMADIGYVMYIIFMISFIFILVL